VYAHLEAIPGLGSLAARGLACGYAQDLGRHAHRTLDSQLFVLRTTDKIRANLLETLDVAAGQSDADTVNGRLIGRGLSSVLVVGSHGSGSSPVDLFRKGTAVNRETAAC